MPAPTHAILLAALLGAGFRLDVEQLTFGPNNHFFGYIGHVKNIPWNGNGRYIAALRTGFQDRMPKPSDAAEVVLIDTRSSNAISVVDRTRGWNFQQGTMFYWNPRAPDTELFFNDRDPKTNHVFTVLFDIAKKKRIREYRFADTPFGNSGVAQNGGRFLGLNYGRLARLRAVTGYPEAHDWARDAAAPANDGIFIVDVESGASRLLVSYRALADLVKRQRPDVAGKQLFINHTLWNRDDNRIYFYLRGDFDSADTRLDIPCTIRPDGTALTAHTLHIGGHPEWENGARIVGAAGGKQIIYDVDQRKVVDTIGGGEIFPKPGGDVALSPDGKLLANGYRDGQANYYVVFRRGDGAYARTPGFSHPGRTSGDLRVDGSPNWNRTNDQILFPGIANDAGHTRQLFLIRITSGTAFRP